MSETKEKGSLNKSQRQNTKKYWDKRFIQNSRPICLLNIDLKLILKALLEILKKVISN